MELMTSPQLKERVQRSIEARVAKLLRELGHPDPPLNLEVVRYLLNINLGYFQKDDNGILDRLAHRLKVTGHQASKRPTLIVDAIKKLDLKALWLPDKKSIMIDDTQPKAKHRWLEGHEIGHNLCDWHGEFLFGDTAHSVSPDCHAKLEAEANFAAGQLLFLGDRFKHDAKDLAMSFKSIKALKDTYGNSMTSTLWRYIERMGENRPMVGLISPHPHYLKRPDNFDKDHPYRYFIKSPAFRKYFPNATANEFFWKIVNYCGPQRGGCLGVDMIEFNDFCGDGRAFCSETFYNQYEALTFAYCVDMSWL